MKLPSVEMAPAVSIFAGTSRAILPPPKRAEIARCGEGMVWVGGPGLPAAGTAPPCTVPPFCFILCFLEKVFLPIKLKSNILHIQDETFEVSF